MKVSVVIPNYNGIDFLKVCLDSLLEQTFKDFEIIVVDNFSKDNSINFIKENYPNVILISLDKNYGFSKAVNEGIKKAKGEYVILINNDTKATPNYIEVLAKEMDRRKNAFSIASKMIQMYRSDLLDSAGDLYTILGWAINRGTGRPKYLYNRNDEIFSSCAGAAIYKKSVLEEIGYFDELHFAYLEDIDVGYRAKLYGYKNYYSKDAIIYHVGSGTSGSKYNDFKVKLSSRNSIYLNYKNMPNWQLILNALPLSFGYLVKYFFFKKKGFEKSYANGIKEGIRTRKKCKRTVDKNIFTYIKIEGALIKNTFIYIIDWSKRKILHK